MILMTGFVVQGHIYVFTVTFDQSSAYFLNKSITYGQININLTDLKLLNISVTVYNFKRKT